MSEWGRLQDVIYEEMDRQGIVGVDVNALIKCIVNVVDLFPGLLGPPAMAEALRRIRCGARNSEGTCRWCGAISAVHHADDCAAKIAWGVLIPIDMGALHPAEPGEER